MIDVITAEIMPSLRESGMSGQVEFLSDLRVFNDHQRSAQASWILPGGGAAVAQG